MIDTFRPLYPTDQSLDFIDKNYPMSWTDTPKDDGFNEINTP
jgi:homogentisate 1,2-dioxygenase